MSVLHATCSNTIQIWTCNEGNMEFYGAEATILSKVKSKSILLPKIHKTLIARHHKSILLYYMLNVDGSSPLVYGCIYCYYYHSLFYSLGHGVTIVMSYCPIVISDTNVSPNCHNSTKWLTIVAPWWQLILENIDCSVWYFESICTILKVMWPGINKSALNYIIQQIGFGVMKYEFRWGWGMDEWKLCCMEMERATLIICNSHIAHM